MVGQGAGEGKKLATPPCEKHWGVWIIPSLPSQAMARVDKKTSFGRRQRSSPFLLPRSSSSSSFSSSSSSFFLSFFFSFLPSSAPASSSCSAPCSSSSAPLPPSSSAPSSLLRLLLSLLSLLFSLSYLCSFLSLCSCSLLLPPLLGSPGAG